MLGGVRKEGRVTGLAEPEGRARGVGGMGWELVWEGALVIEGAGAWKGSLANKILSPHTPVCRCV
jgi:hypothetical protein